MSKSDFNYVDAWAKKIRAVKLLGGKCVKCGNDNIFALDFHHKGGDKDSNYSRIKNYRWSVIEREIKKCILLCKNCHQEHHYPETHGFKKKLMEMSEQYKCKRCGYNKCLTCLDFHHRNRESKKFTFGYVARRNGFLVSWAELMEELGKCDLVCRNCHAIDQIDVDKFNRLKDEIYNKDIKEKQGAIDNNSVIELYNQNLRSCDIAKRLNCARSTICDILKKNGLKTRKENSVFRVSCLGCKKEFDVTGKYDKEHRHFCSVKCKQLGGRKLEWPTKEQLGNDIDGMGWSEIGRKYHVTDNAVRHWARQYGLL